MLTMIRLVLISLVIFSFNLYSQNIDGKPIKVNEKYFTENGNLKNNKDLSVYAIRKIRFTDNSSYEMVILKNNYWYYYSLFQIEQNNQYKYIGNIAFKSYNQNIEGLIGNIVYKDNYFTIEHNLMSNVRMYITFKYNDDKKVYLDKTSMILQAAENMNTENTNELKITPKQFNGNVVPNKTLYKDVTMDMIAKSLSLDI
ncbi:hypothetical protein Q5M87_13965 [Brachyspira innocens]|uniref:Uncharacterized protein n=1 Tax=Brachyspira innocens TaxID=13264 RepID=A0ABT8Z073_9SPIR|nr:hypothetical protein [Brachyspira innocens]MDO6995114.1 hypothetical protein [Brachyspira innocens]MDO7020867.1 hypothetical protein [Brachyspira innocens]